jgi:hypothetical protein
MKSLLRLSLLLANQYLGKYNTSGSIEDQTKSLLTTRKNKIASIGQNFGSAHVLSNIYPK